MSKSSIKKKTGSAASKKDTITLDPRVIRYTHARIRPIFSGCGKRLDDTIQELLDGVISIQDVPLITVVENEGEYFSLNNRRLYVIKHMQSIGKLEGNTIEVYPKTALEKEKKRYTAQRCTLHAKLMPEHDYDESSEDEVEDSATQPVKVTTGDASTGPVESVFNIEKSLAAMSTVDNMSAATDAKVPAEPPAAAVVPPAASKQKAKPATARPAAAPLPADIAKEVKDFAKLVAKGKHKAVLSQIDEWEIAGKISEAQRDSICESIGLVTKGSK